MCGADMCFWFLQYFEVGTYLNECSDSKIGAWFWIVYVELTCEWAVYHTVVTSINSIGNNGQFTNEFNVLLVNYLNDSFATICCEHFATRW